MSCSLEWNEGCFVLFASNAKLQGACEVCSPASTMISFEFLPPTIQTSSVLSTKGTVMASKTTGTPADTQLCLAAGEQPTQQNPPGELEKTEGMKPQVLLESLKAGDRSQMPPVASPLLAKLQVVVHG